MNKKAISSALASLPPGSLLWRGKQTAHHIPTHSTGYAALDQALPGNGWPLGAVTELFNDTTGCGELSLLLPVLAKLSQENHWVTMIDPPWIPYPCALQGRGVALEKLLLVRTKNRQESLWACEQIVRGISGGVMLAWPETLSFSELRRLQLAAKSTRKTVFMFRDQKALHTSSPAVLRLQLTPDGDDLQVRVLKCRGQKPTAPIRIRRPQALQPRVPSLVNSSEPGNRTSASSESPIISLASSRTGRPAQ